MCRSVGPRLIVLTNGDLLEYPFETRADGYEVELPGGLQFVESSRVLCLTTSRRDAWRELRGTYQSLTPDIHVQLARWCIKYQLPDEADELLDALHLDPNRQDARQLLQQVTSRRLNQVVSHKDREAASRIPGAPGMEVLPETRSLGDSPLPTLEISSAVSSRCSRTAALPPDVTAPEFGLNFA